MGTGTRISRRSASGGDDCYFHLDIWRRRRRCSANSYVHKCAHGFETRGCAHGCACLPRWLRGPRLRPRLCQPRWLRRPRRCQQPQPHLVRDPPLRPRLCRHEIPGSTPAPTPVPRAAGRYCRARNGSSTHGCAYTSITTLFPVGESSCYHF